MGIQEYGFLNLQLEKSSTAQEFMGARIKLLLCQTTKIWDLSISYPGVTVTNNSFLTFRGEMFASPLVHMLEPCSPISFIRDNGDLCSLTSAFVFQFILNLGEGRGKRLLIKTPKIPTTIKT